ncbi:hypothetical protein [Halopseudomonas salina]|uniref:Uncharacterized protein n=1 Tax=Halopseudomonas salina TaxID=1323744 RepID=A0ABQ1P5Z5_9GAMM|nr:hypothetical protein [Halopseudomonas salina]GGC87445.1 hypothetical protein GCM10007418_03990 [Halopseudomonas salina]
MSELSVLFPKPVTVPMGATQVTVRPVTLEHFEAFGKAAGELLSMLQNATPAQIYAYARQSGALDVVLGSCTSLGRWRRRRLPAAAAVSLMFAVIQVNSSFFDQALVQAASQLAGSTLSSS